MSKDDILKNLPKGFSEWKLEDELKDEKDIETFLRVAQYEEYNDPRVMGELLRAIAAARELNAAELARRSKLTREGVVRALAKEGNPTIKTLTKIAKTLGVKIKLEMEQPHHVTLK